MSGGTDDHRTAYGATCARTSTPFEHPAAGPITGSRYAGDLATEIAAGAISRAGGAGPARRHARHPRARGDDRPAALGRLRAAPRLRLPRARRTSRSARRAPPSAPAARCGPTTTSPAPTAATATPSPRASSAIRQMTDEQLRARVPGLRRPTTREELLEAALEEHVYRTIAELFGKDEGYCRGRGGGMHIADFSTGHLGANAIVGGSVPIATGAAMALRYERHGPGRVLLRRRRRLRQRRGPRVAQLGRAGPVDQPPGRRPRRTACRSSTSSRTTTTA